MGEGEVLKGRVDEGVVVKGRVDESVIGGSAPGEGGLERRA